MLNLIVVVEIIPPGILIIVGGMLHMVISDSAAVVEL